MSKSPRTSKDQALLIKEALENIEASLVKALTDSIKNLYAAASVADIPPEIVSSEIESYRRRLPEIQLEIVIKNSPSNIILNLVDTWKAAQT